MDCKQFGDSFVLRLDCGEKIVEALRDFSARTGIRLGTISAIGAITKAELGFFYHSTKKYSAKVFEGEFEIVALTGNLTTMGGEPYIHVHAVISDNTMTTFGGHLKEAIVGPTCEIVVHSFHGSVDRSLSNEVGLNLLRLQ
jgi:uncharacterized protein